MVRKPSHAYEAKQSCTFGFSGLREKPSYIAVAESTCGNPKPLTLNPKPCSVVARLLGR